RRHEREAMPPEPTDPAREVVWSDLRPVLDAALDRLPEKYRAQLFLCFLEGKTQEEAARLHCWPRATSASRVHRGRARLRALRVRRGVALSAAGLAVALAQGSASAAVPTTLVRSTVGHAAQVAAGVPAGGTVPASIDALVTGVMRTMKTTKI